MSVSLEETVHVPALMLKQEVAERLRCSVRTVERMLENGLLEKLGGDRVGGSRVRITAASVNRWITKELRPTHGSSQESGQGRLTARSARVDARELPLGPLVPNARQP